MAVPLYIFILNQMQNSVKRSSRTPWPRGDYREIKEKMKTTSLTEEQWERKLHIRTAAGSDHTAHGENYPYEPTPYSVLARLAESRYLTRENKLVDYGCGKGRASIFLAAQTGCRVTGIDYNGDLVSTAKENLARSGAKGVSFLHIEAERFPLTDEDSFFFFNPFSDVILKRVVERIVRSWYEEPRMMQLFFYYPTDEDVAVLTGTPELMFSDEIDCSDLFDGAQQRERILVFETC